MEIRTAELGELQALMVMQLREVYLPGEAASIVSKLFSSVTGLSRSEMVLEKKKKLTESEIYFLQRALNRLKRYEPLQYILGTANFYGLEFEVNSKVLIPRPETEELLAWIISDHKKLKTPINILDIGTGSGCIAITLKKNLPLADVDAIDLSADAIEVAKQNDLIHGTAVNFMQIDILDDELHAGMANYDVIVSNPPYVTPSDREKMQANVTEHEPGLALYVDEDDPLLFYNEIVAFSHDHLKKRGRLYFECNESYANEVVNLLRDNGFMDIELRKDMQGKDRMVRGTRAAAQGD